MAYFDDETTRKKKAAALLLLTVSCVLLYSAFYPSEDLIVKASGRSCVLVEGLPIFCPQFS
jgi:hypothetical protein